jgi:hypothetical protein
MADDELDALPNFAAKVAPFLVSGIDMLKKENILMADLASKTILSFNAVELNQLIASDSHQTATSRFFNVLEARRLLESSNPFGTTSITEEGKTKNQAATDFARDLNAALTALVNANAAIASHKTSRIHYALGNLALRVEKAQATQSNLGK